MAALGKKMSEVVRVHVDGRMDQIRVDQNEMHSLFAPGTMTFVGAIRELERFLVGKTNRDQRNTMRQTLLGEDAFDTVYVIGSDASGVAKDISVVHLVNFLKKQVG